VGLSKEKEGGMDHPVRTPTKGEKEQKKKKKKKKKSRLSF